MTTPARPPTRGEPDEQSSAAVFLVLRRMRLPLMVLILVFAVSVFGLTLVPGEDAAGRPDRLGFFDAFYVMSYTATTIGFGCRTRSATRSGCGSSSASTRRWSPGHTRSEPC